MQVIIVSEEYHGYIGLVKDYQSALSFLINKHYLDRKTEIWVDKDTYTPIEDKYGEKWEQIIRNWNIEDFNTQFEGVFYLYEYTVYEETVL